MTSKRTVSPAIPWRVEGVAGAEVDLPVVGQVRAVRDARAVGQRQVRAQSRADQHVGAHAVAVPAVGDAAGGGHLLLVIEVDVVVGDVGEIVRVKAELARDDVLADGALEGEVAVGLEVPAAVVAGELHAVHLAVAVVEGREDDGRAELPLVDEIGRLLVVAVDAGGERLAEGLLDAEVVVVGALGLDDVVGEVRGRGGGVGELGQPWCCRPARTAAARRSASSRRAAWCPRAAFHTKFTRGLSWLPLENAE